MQSPWNQKVKGCVRVRDRVRERHRSCTFSSYRHAAVLQQKISGCCHQWLFQFQTTSTKLGPQPEWRRQLRQTVSASYTSPATTAEQSALHRQPLHQAALPAHWPPSADQVAGEYPAVGWPAMPDWWPLCLLPGLPGVTAGPVLALWGHRLRQPDRAAAKTQVPRIWASLPGVSVPQLVLSGSSSPDNNEHTIQQITVPIEMQCTNNVTIWKTVNRS